jgi:aspartate carbamoyltransferase regulatory subunit
MKAIPDEVRDILIQESCQVNCPEEVEDYQCPDHSCIVWKLLQITSEKVSE